MSHKLIHLILLFGLITSVFSEEYEMKVKGMVCSFCSKSIEEIIKQIPGVESVKVDMDTRNVTVKTSYPISAELFFESVRKAGYDVEEFKSLDKPEEVK